MPERVVSVKMPSSLVRALDDLRERDHYLDLSEQLRSVVRKKCLELTNPYTEGIRQLRSDIAKQATGKSAKEQVLQDLITLLREEKK